MQEKENFKPGAVLLDMDGLMLDTERPVVDLWIQAAGNLGWVLSQDAVHRVIGINEASSRAVFASLYGSEFPYTEIQKELFRLIYAIVEKTGISCRPGLITLLDHLEKLKIPTAVATSTDRRQALWKLEKAGILDRFPVLVCGDEVSHGKPAPDIFLLAAEKLGVPADCCVGFEDSPAGLRSLAAAGIRSVFVKDVLDPPKDVLATVWREFENLAEAVELFG
jgi:HAD superfamily hydrolase (TIGR01509 family)